MLSGKDIRLRKHRGNQQRVLMAVAKKSLTSISAVTTSKNKNPASSTQGALPSPFHPLSPISPSPSRPLNHHPILNMSLQIRQLTKRISSSRLARKISSVFKESTPTTPGTFVPSYPVFSLSDYRPLSLRKPLCCPIFKNGERPSPGNEIQDMEQQLRYVLYLEDLVDQMLDDADGTPPIKRCHKETENSSDPSREF